MAFKPFKPPSARIATSTVIPKHEDSEAPPPPPSKRRKLHDHEDERPLLRSLEPTSVHRRPLHPIKNTTSPSSRNTDDANDDPTVYFSVLWRKPTPKKNKTWDDDGFVAVKAGAVTLYDSKGKCIGQGMLPGDAEPGLGFPLSGKDVELGDYLSREGFKNAVGQTSDKATNGDIVREQKTQLLPHMSTSLPAPKPKTLKEQMQSQIAKGKSLPKPDSSKSQQQSIQRVPFKQPLKDSTVLARVPSEKPIPRHDPDATGALVFKRPKKAPAGQQVVDVVLDPLLTKRLREHQRNGISFLYECVMGLRDFGGRGCILADDMGLGKTLQTIALIWALVKQNPIYKAEPVIKKALIVCPVSLIQNWKKEFRKWLGRDRLGVLTLEDKGSRLSMFDGKNFKVLIVGYERLRNIAEDLTRGASIDIVICDEGHRLKTLKNKSARAIETLNTSKRVILSGTPIQNDLSEFFAMANFVNDGCLGSYKSFVKDFENPIIKSRQPGAIEEDIEKGEHASEELAQTTSSFILRRTADILAKYLPPKTEYVLFCNPTPEQAKIYQEVVKSPMFQSALGSHESALQLITILKKLCNSPALMRPDRGNDESTSSGSLTTLNEMLPAGISRLYHNSYSSKIRLLDELLHQIRNTTDDKVILVSNYTSTLNLMASLLDSSGGRYLRLDGSTPQGKRQGLVDEFNSSPVSSCFAFLLSAKAGGVGLNLIGANRLVLFDVDWNPATDDQAMARIHREGQKKPCKIYRFLIKGGLEERIWQRQVVKRGLADSIMEGSSNRRSRPDLGSKNKSGKAAFSKEELRDLFRLDESSGLRTHELIKCDCAGQGEVPSNDSELPSTTISRDEVIDVDEIGGKGLVELPSPRNLIKASQLTDQWIQQQERKFSSEQPLGEVTLTEKVERHELMRYAHLDTSSVAELAKDDEDDRLAGIEAIVDDPCLMRVLMQDKEIITGRITYIFKKSTEPEVETKEELEGVEDVES